MKKISIMFAAMVAALGFSACNETWDDNPKLGTHEGDVVKEFLNVPEMTNMSLQITEANATETLTLTCSQPTEYGYAASVAYQVELALNEDFTTPATPSAPATVLLATAFRDCDAINPTLRSIAEAMCKLLDIKDGSQVPTDYMPLYVRLRANVVNENGNAVEGTAFTSNVVSFKHMSCGYLAIVVPGQPTGIYVRGDMNGWLNDQLNDGNNLEVLPLYEFMTTTESNVYELDYIEIDKEQSFKIADKGWGAPNLGIGDGSIVFGQKYDLKWDGGNISFTTAFKGSITLRGSDKSWSMTMDALEADTPGNPSGIYLRGIGDKWDAVSEYEFQTTDVKGVWEIAKVTIPAGSFKVADADWGDLNYGAYKVDGVDVPITAGEKYPLDKGGSNIQIKEPFTGKATLRVKGGNYTLLLEPAAN